MKKGNNEISEKTVSLVMFATLVWLAGLVGFLLLDGFLFSNMWKWWITGTFGVRQITLVEAMAISLLIQYFRSAENITKDEVGKKLLNNLVKDFVAFGLSWFLLFFR